MRMASILFLALLFAATASAQDARQTLRQTQRDVELARAKELLTLRAQVVARAIELRPRRRDTPLRYVGISDNEMREVAQVAREFVPRALVNVSPVVTGCPCEEGPQCTDQLYVIANTAQSTVGLQLVRIEDTWSVGTVQKWWLKKDGLDSRRRTMTQQEFELAEITLLRSFPACLPQTVTVQNK